jgi:hypothetical protein
MEAPAVALCIVTLTGFVKVPPFGLMLGVATVPAGVTLSVRVVDLVTPRPVAVTVIGKVPAGVETVVVTVKTVEQFGLQDGTEKDDVDPEGLPETAKETA